MNLNDDQSDAIAKLNWLKVGALFMEPGTGKTRVALNIINSADTDFVLFVCPFQTKYNLLNEIHKWGISIEFEIVGVETLSSSDNTFMRLLNILQTKT
ncbi:DEAD/DEAH box helicase family protein [Levilactobacillus andaensis]|uniref:DEAD/DEAH box helicase family protein n=1 Tax=Levilactobacillus andaensis TaxID=2799570 RepID=UPI00194183BC|nr:DEAD/DEAH box helicase family protein [Levilactobacillus andaensis]